MLFEVFILGSTALNARDRPRTLELPVIKALHSDGLGFFLVRLRLATYALPISRPSFTFLAVFFIWAMTTTILGRLLIHLRRTECRPLPRTRTSSYYSPNDDDEYCLPIDYEEYDLRRRSRAISPFGLVPLNRHLSGASAQSDGDGQGNRNGEWGHARATSADSPLEITQIPQAYPYHYRKRTYDQREC
ncbi:hypothetical protein L227DRAFT_616379 [Lentinus tigrinus ALCF2SS1-6]|uniref:Uncharacterized protein n=1 Tax=Lentinus tigrinus ALCF2SS1-6 TaxID=1328759 RepID=A0A5C2RSL2_9APHY|nr:hypothetical protein L227DRAFT_616379 [Lentinus tigrinus ALCF2SS1-6]